MAPSHSRQLLAWTLPTIAILLSYLWFKKKKVEAKSDPTSGSGVTSNRSEKSIKDELDEATRNIAEGASASPNRSFSRSLSGVDTAPIDIIVPRKLRSHKSTPVVISDEDLDFEIQKIKSMKNGCSDPFKRSQSSNDGDTGKKASPLEDKKGLLEKQKETFSPDSFSSSPITPQYKSPKVIKCTPQKVILSSSTSPMAQKHAKSAEKLICSKVETQEACCKTNKMTASPAPGDKSVESEEVQRQSVDRDSANHSPADVMLASPSLSSISDNHSEGSNDSGKGCSDVATPPSRTPAGDGSISGDIPMLYEFVMPQNLVGRLIGRGGCLVSDIKEKSGTHIMIKKHPTNPKMKLCAIEGPQLHVDKALQMIREKFPLKRYSEVTLQPFFVEYPPPSVCVSPDQLYLKLVEGINNDTIISCMVAPNHFFIQQPTHPSFPSLNTLCNYMNMCYNHTDTPLLPTPIEEHTVCVAESEGDWYRAMIVSTDTESDTSYVIFLDYGGYGTVENSKLRQIRGDFLLLPFQSQECILANVRPVGGPGSKWLEEAYRIVAEITNGALAYTQVADYTSGGVPLVLMYIFIGPQEYVFLNEELVKRGLAEWEPLTQQYQMEPLRQQNCMVPHLPQQSEREPLLQRDGREARRHQDKRETRLRQVESQPVTQEDETEGAVGGVAS